MKILSFNLRTDNKNDGINYFFNRSNRVKKVIIDEKPDIIGFQEGTEKIRTFLYENLEGYTVLGCGRNTGYKGEGIPIAFRTGKYDLITFETKCLSLTPEIIGTTYGGDQSKYPRMYHRVKLRDRENDMLITFYNIHTDHLGFQTQVLECRQLLEDMKKHSDENIIVTGDFNATPDSETISVMTSDPVVPLKDLTSDIPFSFNLFGHLTEERKIDYIFSNMEKESSYAIKNEPIDGVYISDHNPIIAIIK